MTEPNTTPKTLTIRVDATEDVREEALAVAEAVERGEDPEPMHALALGSDAELARLVSEANLELLRVVATERPESIHETARLVDRDYKGVHRNLDELETLGVVTFDDDGYGKAPRVEWGALEIRLDLRPDSGGDGAERVAAAAAAAASQPAGSGAQPG